MSRASFALIILSATSSSVLACSSSDEGSSSSGGRAAAGGSGGKANAGSANGGSASGGAANAGGANGGAASGGASSGACPNLAGNWTVKTHCQSSQVGKSVSVTQTGCTVSVPSFSFSGTVGPNGELNLSGGGISCTGSAMANLITEQCTVLGQPCSVSLSR